MASLAWAWSCVGAEPTFPSAASKKAASSPCMQKVAVSTKGTSQQRNTARRTNKTVCRNTSNPAR
eukprot:2526572-Alexandrium_andersonii.AAC.1